MGEPAGLAKEHQRALDRLTKSPEIRAFYLAGETAIAVHLRHRQSLDLDFFSLAPSADLDRIKTAVRGDFADVRVVRETDASLHLVCDGTPIDFVSYPYPLLEAPATGPSGVAIAGLLDLSVMKLAAISRRGIRRDFWDLFAIMKNGMPLERSGEAYVRRFGVAEADLCHVLRALTYFDDAEKDPAFPRGMTREEWEVIKAFFREQAPALVR
jgi:nucleotidyltransferase AbiEii toxin of type IV toxin-antitoxin system